MRRRGCGSPPRAPRLGRASLPGAPLLGCGSAPPLGRTPHPAAPRLCFSLPVRNSSNPVRVAPDSGCRPGPGADWRSCARCARRLAAPAARRCHGGALTCDDAQYRPHPGSAPRAGRAVRRLFVTPPVRCASRLIRVSWLGPGADWRSCTRCEETAVGTGRGPATGRADARCHPLHRPRPWLCPSMPVRNSSSRCSWRLIRASWPGLSAEWRSCARVPARARRPRPPPTGGVSRIAGSR